MPVKSESWKTHQQLARLKAQALEPKDSFEFAVIGDVEPCRFRVLRYLFNQPRVFRKQLSSIQKHPADFCVQLGDMVSRGTERYYRGFIQELEEIGVCKPYLTVIGNHDRSHPNLRSHSKMYRRVFGRKNYFFDYHGVRFIVLDSSARCVLDSQLRWLKAVLQTPLRKIIFTHMPPDLLGIWGGSWMHAWGGFSRGARQLCEMAAEYGVCRVYCGHVHAFGVQDYLGVRYILTGGGGSALFPVGVSHCFHHYLTVSVGPQRIVDCVHPVHGPAFHIPPDPIILPVWNETLSLRVARKTLQAARSFRALWRGRKPLSA